MSAQQSARLAHAAGLRGRRLVEAVAIAGAESDHRDGAVGDEHLTDDKWGPSVGRWQIRSLKAESGTGGFRDAQALRNPSHNAEAMVHISRAGTRWGPWSAYTNGTYREHMAEAERAVQAVESGASGGGGALVPIDSNDEPAPWSPRRLIPDSLRDFGSELSELGVGGTVKLVGRSAAEVGLFIVLALAGVALVVLGAWRLVSESTSAQ